MQGEDPVLVPLTVSPGRLAVPADLSPSAAMPDQAICLEDTPPKPRQGFKRLPATSQPTAVIPIPSGSAAAAHGNTTQQGLAPSDVAVPDWMLAGPTSLAASDMVPRRSASPLPLSHPHHRSPHPRRNGLLGDSHANLPEIDAELAAASQANVLKTGAEPGDAAATPAADVKARGPNTLRPIPIPRYSRVETPVVRPALSRARALPLQDKSMNISNNHPSGNGREAGESLAKWSAARVWDPPRARLAPPHGASSPLPGGSVAGRAAKGRGIEPGMGGECRVGDACANSQQGLGVAEIAHGEAPRGALPGNARGEGGAPSTEGRVLDWGPSGVGSSKEKPRIPYAQGYLAVTSGMISFPLKRLCALLLFYVLLWGVLP
jgi:hypothetical protein